MVHTADEGGEAFDVSSPSTIPVEPFVDEVGGNRQVLSVGNSSADGSEVAAAVVAFFWIEIPAAALL